MIRTRAMSDESESIEAHFFDGAVNMTSDDAARIRAERLRRKMSQRQLGARVGISQAAIEKIESGKTEKSKYTRELLVTLGLENGANDVPVVGYVSAGQSIVLYAYGQGPFDTIKGPPGSNERTVALMIKGDSLGPIFGGWYAFYDDVREPPTEDLLGELCVVGIPDGRVLLKQIKKSRSPGLYHLISATEPPMTDVPVAWAAKVRFMSSGLAA